MKTLHISIRPRSPPAACAPDRPLVTPSTPRPFAAYPSLSLGNLAETKTKFMNVFCHVWMADCLTDRPTDSLTDWPVRQYDCQSERRGTPTRKHTHIYAFSCCLSNSREEAALRQNVLVVIFLSVCLHSNSSSDKWHAACGMCSTCGTHTHTYTNLE